MLVKVLTNAGALKGYFNTSCIQGSDVNGAGTAITFIVGGNNGGARGANQIRFTINITVAEWDEALAGNPPAGTPKSIGSTLIIQETS